MGWRWCCALVILLFLPFMASSRSIINTLPGFEGDLPFKLETGYIGVGEADEVQLFYYFVESGGIPSEDPVLIWFIGGPGCSAFVGFFLENGPLVFNHNYIGGLPNLELNLFSWTKVLNIIYVDMPVGTGFSYSTTQEGYYTSDTQWVEHAYSFLQKWFIDHPEFGSNRFYVGGGSYSGKIVPPLVEKVYEGYRAGSIPVINIQGYILASPLTDVYEDENSRVEYAHRLYLIPDELYESMKTNCDGDYVNINPNNSKCVADYEAYSDLVRYVSAVDILNYVCLTTPNQRILVEDSGKIRQSTKIDTKRFWCEGYDDVLLENWANNETVREALHVRKGTKGIFRRCNETLSITENLPSVVEFHVRLANTDLQSLVYWRNSAHGPPKTRPNYGNNNTVFNSSTRHFSALSNSKTGPLICQSLLRYVINSGYPPKAAAPATHMAMAPSSSSSPHWLMDSSAFHHVANDFANLTLESHYEGLDQLMLWMEQV